MAAQARYRSNITLRACSRDRPGSAAASAARCHAAPVCPVATDVPAAVRSYFTLALVAEVTDTESTLEDTCCASGLAAATTNRLWTRHAELLEDNVARYLQGRQLRNVVDKTAGY